MIDKLRDRPRTTFDHYTCESCNMLSTIHVTDNILEVPAKIVGTGLWCVDIRTKCQFCECIVIVRFSKRNTIVKAIGYGV
jgi:hypothetical protein